MNPLVIMGCVASNGIQSGPKLFTITVGGLSLPKIGSYRGYGGISPAFGSVSPNDIFDGRTVERMSVFVNATAPAQYAFNVVLSGDTSSSTLLVTPQNYGSTLGPLSGAYNAPSDSTSYVASLPNANLWNNWTVDSLRTCQLEWA